MTRQYAAFDEVTIGTGLVLTQGDQILATSSTVDIHRHARSTFSLDQFQGSVEARLFGTGTLASGKMRIGLVTGAASTAMSVGEDVNGWGWDPYDGKIYSNNAVVATIGTAAFGDTVSLSIDPLTGAMTIAKNNAVIGAYVIGAGAFYIAATVSGAPGAKGRIA